MANPVFALIIGISAALAIIAAQMGQMWTLTVFKSLTTILIIAYFWRLAGRLTYRFGVWILLGLLFCLLGDALLLDEQRFVFGLGAFLIGHLLFLVAFVRVKGWHWHLPSLAGLVIVSGGYWWRLQPNLAELSMPVALYSSVIAIMCWQAIGLASAIKGRDITLIAIGAALFIFSDATIAWNKFVHPFEWSPLVILSTYWIAIFLIADGAAALNRRLAGSDHQ